jgi:excisionase family DNA binding protein
MPESNLLSPDELADYLKVPVKTIYNWRSEGKGPRGIRVGRHVRFRASEIEAWLDRHVEGGVFG